MGFRFDIQTVKGSSLYDLFGQEPLVGAKVDFPGGQVAMVLEEAPSRGFGLGELTGVLLDWAPGAIASIPAGLLTNWLYDVLKDKVKSLRTAEKVYQINHEQLLRFVAEFQEKAATEVAAQGMKP